MRQGLFRQQAVDKQRVRLYGEVILRQPIGMSLIALATTLFVILGILLLVQGNFARKVTVSGYLKPHTGLIKLQTPRGGSVGQLLVSEGEQVVEGQPLLIVRDHRQLESGSTLETELLSRLQQQEQLLQQQLDHGQQMDTVRKAEYLARQQELKQSQTSLKNQQKLIDEQVTLAKTQLERLQTLQQANLMAQIQLDEARTKLLQLQSQTLELDQRLVQAKQQLQQLHWQYQQQNLQTADATARLHSSRLDLVQQRLQLQGQEAFVLKASQAGTITNIFVQLDSLVQPGQVALHLLPHNSVLEAHLLVPPHAIGFIAVGQAVKIRFDAFPYQKFGLYSGRVSKVASTVALPNEARNLPIELKEAAYPVTVSLDQQTITAFGHPVALKPGMKLVVDIRLAERSLLEWLLEPIFSLKGYFA